MNKLQYILTIVFCCVGMFVTKSGAVFAAEETFIFRGEIANADKVPVSGAEVSFYKTNNVKKPANFVSNRTGNDGKYQVVLPEGTYWAFATLRKDGRKFGPLGLNDKHSGEAIEVSVGPEDDLEQDFLVLDLREAAKKNQKKNDILLRVSGRIIDQKGAPVKLAYAMADTVKRTKSVPKYLSAWTDDTGEYILFLPRGVYYLGTSVGFPPNADYSLSQEIIIDGDQAGINLTLPKTTNKN